MIKLGLILLVFDIRAEAWIVEKNIWHLEPCKKQKAWIGHLDTFGAYQDIQAMGTSTQDA